MEFKKPTYIFIVSTPRAGSTLLQSMLVTFKGLVSGKESHFYSTLYNKNFLRKKFYNKQKEISNNLGEEVKINLFSLQKSRKNFRRALDKIIKNNNAVCFVEKTPMHLHYLEQIQKDFENPVVFHIVRDAYENIRSLYIAANENPKSWTKKRSIEDCINRWNQDLEIHKKYNNQKNHYFIKYEDIKEDRKRIEAEIEKILKNTEKQDYDISTLIDEEETWKENNLNATWKNTDYKDKFIDKKEFYESYGNLVLANTIEYL